MLELAREDVKGQEQVAQVESLAPVASGAFADRVEVRLTLREGNLVKRDREIGTRERSPAGANSPPRRGSRWAHEMSNRAASARRKQL